MVNLTCPFCGWNHRLPVSDNKWVVVECDEEDGGCGELFVYQTDVIRTVLKRKVEGRKEDAQTE